LTKIKEFTVPTQVNSASLHPDATMFVCCGEDFKMYKFDYNTGAELGEISFFISKDPSVIMTACNTS